MEIFGVSVPALLSQLLLGLVNGSFYAILSLGLAVIFGLLNVINFAHGALFMLGAMFTWMAASYFQINYWVMLLLSPILVGVVGMVIERFLLRHIYKLDHLYGLLLTLGLSLLIEGVFRSLYGVSGLGYDTPELLEGATNVGVNHDVLALALPALAVMAITGQTGEVGHDGVTRLRHPVEQGGFAHVGTPHQSNNWLHS